MTKQLVTLEAFNASRTNELQKERQAELEKIREKYSNGIECPAWDTESGVIDLDKDFHDISCSC